MTGPGETPFAAGGHAAGGHGTDGRATAAPSGPHGLHEVELVGSHLHVRGHLALGRFPRLADLVNHDRGAIVLHDATMLDASGRAMDLTLPELAVNQDEVTFIGHGGDAATAGGHGGHGGHGHPGAVPDGRFVLFTPGHTISGMIHRFRDPSLANFISATDPRFFEVTDARARSQRVPAAVIRHGCLLVNRTRVSAIAELPEGARDPTQDGVAGEFDPAPRSGRADPGA